MTTERDEDMRGSVPAPPADLREHYWEEIEPELRPDVDRSLAPHARRRCALEARNAARWRSLRSEPLLRLGGDALLARTEARILAFWRGDRDEDAPPAVWPLNDAQRDAVRGAAVASSAAERLAVVPFAPHFGARLRQREVMVETASCVSERGVVPGAALRGNVG